VAPFTLTPVNLLLTQLEATPAVGVVVTAMGRRGLDDEAKRVARADRVWLNSAAKQGAGAALMAYGAYLASQGRLSPPYSPREDQSDKRSRELRDIPAGSIKVGDQWHSVMQLGPQAAMIMLGGAMYTAAKDPELLGQPAAQAGAAAGKVFTTPVSMISQRPLAQGISDATRVADQLMGGDERGQFRAYAGRTIASFIPFSAAWAAAGRAMDPVRDRKADSFSSAMSERLPGLRQTVAPRVDALGRTSTPEPVVEQYGNPLRSRGERTDPVTRVLADHNVTPDALDRVPGETAVERAQAQRQLGQVVERVVTQVTGSAPVRDNEKLEELRQDWANAERIAREEEETPGYIRSEILRAALTESRKIWRATPEGKARRRAERANRARRQDLEQQRLEQRRRSRD
jgi:hypothetical protein